MGRGCNDGLGLVLSWVAARQFAQTLAAKCPAGATDKQCITAYVALASERATAGRELDRDALLRTDLIHVGPELRQQAVDILEGVLLEANLEHVTRVAWRRAVIVALRWDAEARAALARKQPCRAPADLGAATLGEPLEIDDSNEYLVALRAPGWTNSGAATPTRYLLSVNCALAPPK